MMIIPLSTKVKAEGVWNYSSFIEGTESGEIVHHAQGDAGSVKNVTYSETVGNFNNVSFKVRPNATWNYEVEAHFSFYITTPSGIIGFKFMNYWKAVRVESMDNSYNVNSFIHDAVNYDT